MAELNSSIEKLRDIRADRRHIKTMEEKVTVCSENLKSLQDILECKDKYSEQKFNAAARRRAQNLVNENRLRNRKAGAGAKRKLDDIDEELIAKAIEQKTTVHGRRHDMVLYYHKRVKRRLAKHCKLQPSGAWKTNDQVCNNSVQPCKAQEDEITAS